MLITGVEVQLDNAPGKGLTESATHALTVAAGTSQPDIKVRAADGVCTLCAAAQNARAR
jgi:hypothetical protein